MSLISGRLSQMSRAPSCAAENGIAFILSRPRVLPKVFLHKTPLHKRAETV